MKQLELNHTYEVNAGSLWLGIDTVDRKKMSQVEEIAKGKLQHPQSFSNFLSELQEAGFKPSDVKFQFLEM